MNQYKPYHDSVEGWQPWVRDGKPVVEGPKLGFVCDQGHNTFININTIRVGVVAKYQCEVCSRPNPEVHARIWIEAKLDAQLQLQSAHAGAVYTCAYGNKQLRVAIGDQFAPVPHPRLLVPATTDERKLEIAWKRFNEELATEEQA